MDHPRFTTCTVGLHMAFTLGDITFNTSKETSYLLDDRETGVQFPAGERDTSFLHIVQIGS
jgi:hypothetical protein